MSQTVTEGLLQFEFDERWTTKILEWDRHSAYLEGIQAAGNCKAVDFIGILDNRLVHFIEVKDYRLHRRLKQQEARDELLFKVRDTIAGLVGAGRRPQHAELCRPFLEAMLKPHKLTVVLWFEQRRRHAASSARGMRSRVGMGVALREDKSLFRWLHARVVYASREDDYEPTLPDLKVTSLPLQRSTLIALILKTLKDRRVAVDAISHRRIMDHTEISELQTWLERAAEVSTVQEVFSDAR